jgi:hypothetical protein
MSKQLDYLREQETSLLEERAALVSEVDAIIDAAADEQRSLKPEEDSKLDERAASIAEKDAAITKMRERIKDAEEREARSEREAEVRAEQGQTGTGSEQPRAKVGKEPETYRKGGDHSYFRDLTMVGLGRR